MGSLAKRTGGVMVMSDTFEHEIFRKSLQKMFEKDDDGNLRLAFNSPLEVFVRVLLVFSAQCTDLFRPREKLKSWALLATCHP